MRRELSLSCLVTVVALVAGGMSAVPVAYAAPADTQVVPAAVPVVDNGLNLPIPSQPELPRDAAGELTGLRSARASTVAQADGSFVTSVATQPVNYRDPAGVWQHIDNTLVRAADGTSRTKAGSAVLSLPASLDTAPVRLTSGSLWVDTQLVGATGVPTLAGATATVRNALPGVDVVQTSTTTGTKEELVLGSAAAPSSFSYRMSTSAGLAPSLRGDGTVALTDAGGVVRLVLPEPFMDDAKGAHSDAVSYALAASGTGWVLTVTADAAWLGAAGRAFPVRVDPSISDVGANGGLSCTLRVDAPDTAECGASTIQIGADAGGPKRALLKFADVGTQIPARSLLVQSQLVLPMTAASTGASTSVDVRAATAPFTSSSTWNTQPGVAAPEARSTATPSQVGATLRLYASQMTRDWIGGASANNGLMLIATDETTNQLMTFAGIGSQVACLPGNCLVTTLRVTWEERLGKAPAQQFYDVSTTDRASAHVNLSNGNLVVSAQELSGLTRTYNSLHVDRLGQLGTGWTLDTAGDVRVDEGLDGAIRYYGPGGTQFQFFRRLDGTYVDAPGLNASAKVQTLPEGERIFVTFHQSSSELKFERSTGHLLTVSDRNANKVSTFTWGTGGVVSSMTDLGGRVTTFNHTGTVLTGLSDVATRTTGYTITSNDLVSARDAVSKSTLYAYDTSHRLTKITNPAGEQTNVTYDTKNRVKSLMQVTSNTNQTGPTTTFAYTDIAQPVAVGGAARGTTVVTDANIHTTTYLWDTSGAIRKTTDALSHARSADYTSNGDVTKAIDAMGTGGADGNSAEFQYDTDYRMSGTKAPQVGTGVGAVPGAASTVSYSEAPGAPTNPFVHWQPISNTSTEGNTTSITYDARGNVSKTQDTTPQGANGGVAHTFTRQGDNGTVNCGGKPGQVCSDINGNAKATTFTYDTAGNRTKIAPPTVTTGTQLGATSYTYDNLGRVKTRTDGKAQVTGYTYDGADRVLQMRFNGTTTCSTTSGTGDVATGKCILYTFDNAGRPATRKDTTGTTTYGYDALGRQTSGAYPNSQTVSLSYDAVGNVTSYTDAGATTTYRYNDDNTLRDLAAPSGSCVNTISKCLTYGYDANRNRTSTTYSNGVTTTRVFDESGRAKSIVSAKAGTTYSSLAYSYATPAGAQRALTQTRTDALGVGGPANSTTAYGYDTLERLKTADETTAGGALNASWGYTYDNDGNRLTDSYGGTVQNTYTYNENDVTVTRGGSTAGISYDANGNETAGAITGTASTWGAYTSKDQAASVVQNSATTSFAYAGADNRERVSSTKAGVTTQYLNGPEGVTTRTASSSTDRIVREPNGTPVAYVNGTATAIYYYLADNLGSTVALADLNGALVGTYSYDPYGVTRTATPNGTGTNTTVTNGQPIRYTGGWLDASGAYKLGYRYYNPAAGRFTQPDPTGQEANAYLYAAGNPANAIDLSGGFSVGLGTALGGIVGGIVATVAVGAVCGLSLGVGCIAAGIVAGAVFTSAGSVAGAGLAGGTDQEQLNAARDGAVAGALLGGTLAPVGRVTALAYRLAHGL